MDVTWSTCVYVIILHVALLLITSCQGVIQCECTTHECHQEGQSTCIAQTACYTELFRNEITRGCDPNQLSCESRKPAGLNLEWPALYCCTEEFCNKYVVPIVKGSTPSTIEEAVPSSADEAQHDIPNSPSSISDCANTKTEVAQQDNSKIINPIYIAVPVAGVCVLLALIIFALYLLRRRTYYHHHHEGLYHYQHEHVPAMPGQHHHHPHHPGHHQKPAVAPHHCQCMCQKQTLPASSSSCSKGGNRCTDSERSSSGSETKLFIQS